MPEGETESGAEKGAPEKVLREKAKRKADGKIRFPPRPKEYDMKKALKIIGITLLVIVIVAVLAVGGYVIYVVAEYDRIPDNQKLDVEGGADSGLGTGVEYTAVTYNIGFGAYTPDFTFFMDSGVMSDGTEVAGKLGKAIDKEHVLGAINGASGILKAQNADFILVQEVDTDADRSYHVNELGMLNKALGEGYDRAFAVNFHSAYLMYPLNDFHGKTTAGIVTYSRYNITESVRRSYPVDDGLAKFFDLDRCFMLNRIPVEGGRELVLINSHMSAYDEGGAIREQQLRLLNEVIAEEYGKGNYVVVGGDFNHELADSLGTFPSEQQTPEWAYPLTDDILAEGFRIVATKEGTGTCRAAEIPYEKGVNYLTVPDGFIVSDNVETISIENIDTGFAFSDHNPVKFTFKLK